MKSKIILFLSLVVLIASCSSEKKFSSRHYTKGRYASHKSKVTTKEKNNVIAETSKEVVIANNEPTVEKSISKGEYSQELKENAVKSEKSKEKSTIKERTKQLRSTLKELKKEIKADKKALFKSPKELRKQNAEGTLSTKALLGLIFGIVGMVVNTVANILVYNSSYAFIFLFIFGLVFGILALVFGLGGISDYSKGNKNILNLIFGIVGACLGVAAIVTAIYYAIFGIIDWLEYLDATI